MDVALGYDKIVTDRALNPYFGSTVGRVANRISGIFEISSPFLPGRNLIEFCTALSFEKVRDSPSTGSLTT